MTGRIETIRGPDDFAAAFDVSRETLDRLRRYTELLERWQKVQNLVSPRTLPEVWQRHFADSAQLLEHAPPFGLWLDLGSGAGFPGLVIAILAANRQDAVVHLVESNGRKCAFLAEVARCTEAAVEIHNLRIESLSAANKVMAPDIVSARALASLDDVLDLAQPLFGRDTVGLLLKGRQAAEELEAARKRWTFDARLIPSRTQAGAHIVELRDPRPAEKPRMDPNNE